MLLKSDISKIAELQAEVIRSADNGLRRESIESLPALSKHALIITGIRRCGKSTLLYQFITEKYPDAFFLNFDDILIRDIVVRYRIRDIKSLQRLALYLVSNTAKPVTGTKLKQAVGISATSTILEYFSFLESSYLFSFVPRFSYSAKSQLINPRKIYVADPGLITVNSNSFSDDSGRKLENIVFNYLRSHYKEIFYFLGRKECDFIVKKRAGKPQAMQVCYNLDKENLDREIDGLHEALITLGLKEGVIITLNQKDKFTFNGFTAHVIPAFEFLSKAVT